MKTKKIRILALLLVGLVLLPNIVSCGGRKYKFDPGFYEINIGNYAKYLEVDIEKGKKDFSQARDTLYIEYEINSKERLQYMDCYVTVKFTANEQSITEKISLEKSGKAAGSIEMTFAKSYTVEYGYEIVDVSGTLYDDGEEDGTAYIIYNNVRYEESRQIRDEKWIKNWKPVFKKRNNTETLYFTDKIYTESGVAINFYATSIFFKGWDDFWYGNSPMNKVKTFIFDGSIKYSDLEKMGWENVHTTMPNLQTIYIKNLVDDGGSISDLWDMALPVSGVDFYIGGDIERISEVLSEVDFVNSINSADDFDLSKYEKDNKR